MFMGLNVPYVSKLLITIYIKYGANRKRIKKDAKGTVFAIYEPRFKYLLKEIEERGFNVLILGRGIFDYLFRKHLSDYIKENRRTTGEYALSVYEHYKEDRKRYLKDCMFIAELLKKHFSASTIILPKYNDDYTLELVQAFHNSGWKTIVYDREGTVTKRRLEYLPAIVSRQASTCDYLITYNETHRAFFEKVFDLSDAAKPEIIVMGNPASDEWFLNGQKRPVASESNNKRKILFFAFGEFSYVYDAEYLKDKDEVWRDLLTEIHLSLMEHMNNNPNDILHYKRGPKGNRDYWAGSEKLLTLSNAQLIPATASANKLIVWADIIIAFQTTALIDAMHTDKVIIYCAWGDNYQELKKDLIRFDEYALEGGILHARSPEELKQILSLDHKEIVINVEARKKVRELFTTNPDGKVAKRFADWFVETCFPDS